MTSSERVVMCQQTELLQIPTRTGASAGPRSGWDFGSVRHHDMSIFLARVGSLSCSSPPSLGFPPKELHIII